MSKEWLLEEEGYMVEEMLMRGSVEREEGGSCEDSEAGGGERLGCGEEQEADHSD